MNVLWGSPVHPSLCLSTISPENTEWILMKFGFGSYQSDITSILFETQIEVDELSEKMAYCTKYWYITNYKLYSDIQLVFETFFVV
jgi:hypothetical protein